jgi:hypothetical protein
VQDVQAPRYDTTVNCARGQSQLEQLDAGHDAVLELRKRRDRRVGSTP